MDRKILYIIWLIILGISLYINHITKDNFIILTNLLGGKYMPVIMIGSVISIFENKDDRKKGGVIVTLSLLLIITSFSITYIAILCLTAAIVYMALREKIFFLKYKPLTFLGKYSYSIYVIHQNIGFIILNALTTITGEYRLWMTLLTCMITCFLGITIYTFERKSNIFFRNVKRSF